ncbi:MAG: elongation factor G [Candidatus Omnitrophota bacterium]
MDNLAKKWTFLLCGHAQCGKTTLGEAILFNSGATSRLGKVEEGTTTSDYEDDEKERKSSINMGVLNAQYKENSFQVIDTPGYLDFIGELIAAIRAVDFAVMVVDATGGIEVGTEKAWELLKREKVPCLFFINKIDKENTDFKKTLEEIKQVLDKRATSFVSTDGTAVFNIIHNKGKDPALYSVLVEAVAESDDALLEKYLDSGSLEEEELNNALKKAVIASKIFPVVGGVASQEIGVETVMDIIAEIMPAVGEFLPRQAKDDSGGEVAIYPRLEDPFSAQVIKTIIDPYVGQLSIFRVFSGRVLSNSEILNATKGHKEKIGQLYSLQGKQQLAQDTLSAGDIGAVAKLKNTQSQDTFCDSGRNFQFGLLDFPSPAYSASVKPKTRQDEEKISSALSRLTSEDPTFGVSRDTQTKELIISGMGELHLNVIIERMKRKYNASVELGTPKVPYKETITKAVKVQNKYKKQTGGRGQYGDVWIEVEPLERGKNFEFVDKIVGGAIPRNFIPSVEKGIRKSMGEGILAGFPIYDIRVILYDGSYHPVDSSDIAFQIAGSMALRKALEQAGSVLLEPIMNVEITVPGDLMGQITGDINGRRGRVLGMEAKGKNELVKAKVPLAEMFKYASDLRSVTGGRGNYAMSFSHYEVVPARITQTIIEQAKADKKE